MTFITFQNGAIVFRNGLAGTQADCCCGCSGACDEENPCPPGCICVDGQCQSCISCDCAEFCVSYSFTVLGDLEIPDTPEDETLYGTMTAGSCPEGQTCFNFGYLDQFGNPIYPDYNDACTGEDFDFENYTSYGGMPAARLRCIPGGEFVLEVCLFNACFGMDPTSGIGRLTTKTYAVNLDEDGCPTSIGAEQSSSVSDWWGLSLAGEWEPFDTNPYDWTTPDDAGLCNQECWGEWPFDFVVGTWDGVDCNPLP